MRRRRIDPRRIKIHFSYTIEEAARALAVHKNTVRAWIREGLPVADERRPLVITGGAIRAFLNERLQARKRPLAPGEFYCLRCRDRTRPFDEMVDLVPDGTGLGTLHGLCPVCACLIYRRVSIARWRGAAGDLAVTIQPATATLNLDRSPHPKP